MEEAAELDKISPTSAKQMAYLMYDLLNFQTPKIAKGKRTTNKGFIDQYRGHELVDLLEQLRIVRHMLDTYVYGIEDDIAPDGRVHPDFLPWGTVTGRLAIKNPPLQTIPRESTIEEVFKGKFDSIRRLFIPDDGMTWVSADYSALELHMMHHCSGDTALAEGLASGDFHSVAAARMWNMPIENVTSETRKVAKLVTFGVAYERGAKSLATGSRGTTRGSVGGSVAEAQAYIDAWHEAFPQYTQWAENQKKLAIERGWVQTLWGRKRRWSLITPQNKHKIERQAVNFPMQSSASDLCLYNLIRLNKALREKELGYALFSVHDSVEAEIWTDRLEEGMQVVKDTMEETPFESEAEFPVKVGHGPSWGDCAD